MGLGVVSDLDFASELANVRKVDGSCASADAPSLEGVSEEPLVPEIVRDDIRVVERSTERKGRKAGDVNVPESLRKLIASEHIEQGREAAVELAKSFGVSSSSVSAYAKGATSTASYKSPSLDLQKFIASRKAKLTKKALRVLQNSLDEITPDKLSGLKARELASVAKDMSAITKNMEPENSAENASSKPQFVVYAPQIRDERSYDTIVVSDNY